MDDKNKFQEMLGDILEIARVQGNQLGMNEIREMFGNMNLSEEQYEHIFAYLAANHINIKGYVAKDSQYTKAVEKANEEENRDEENQEENKGNKQDTQDEDSAYLKMYLGDIGGIKESTPEEEKLLIDKIASGDEMAKSRYIEGNLHYVVNIAKEYKNQGVTMEDLIQEGNMGLISSLETISEWTDVNQVKTMVTDSIRKSIEAAIREQNESTDFEKTIVGKINRIREAADELAEDLGRKADIHELARYMNLPEQEIADLVNMSVEGIKLVNGHISKSSPAIKHFNHGHNHDNE